MKLPIITGLIKRRFLINYRIDLLVLQNILPKPFSPKLINGYGLGGICLIQLEAIRPKFFNLNLGINSENAAHRFAVKWGDKEGVYIPRRDTDSLINHMAGGRLFPGIHYRSRFEVKNDNGLYEFKMKSIDKKVDIKFKGSVSQEFEKESIFTDLPQSSKFFQDGSIGYSETRTKNQYDGIELKTRGWKVKPFTVSDLYSSFFQNEELFPKGSIQFDHALFMENVDHDWINVKELKTTC